MGLLQFLNPLNAIITGVTSYLNKREDTALEKYKVDGRVDVTLIQARQAVASLTARTLGDRLARYIFIYPTGLWYGLIIYDSSFRNLLPVGWTWRVLDPGYPTNHIVYAVIGYLFLQTIRPR